MTCRGLTALSGLIGAAVACDLYLAREYPRFASRRMDDIRGQISLTPLLPRMIEILSASQIKEEAEHGGYEMPLQFASLHSNLLASSSVLIRVRPGGFHRAVDQGGRCAGERGRGTNTSL